MAVDATGSGPRSCNAHDTAVSALTDHRFMSTNLSPAPVADLGPSPLTLTLTLSVEHASYRIVLPHADSDYLQKRLVSDHAPFEREMLEDICTRVLPDGLVLDIGAGIGNCTLYLAATAGCHVESFERDPELRAALRESIALNAFGERVRLHETGVGDEAEMADTCEIRRRTLDDFQFDRKVAVIKLSVEDTGIDILEGASQLLQRDRPLIYVTCSTEAQRIRVSRWLSARSYAYWDTFNATPTHLFIPGERLSVEQLHRLQTKAARTDCQSNQLLREVRERMSHAQAKEREARADLASAQAQQREVREALAAAQTRERQSRASLAKTQTQQRRTNAALADAQARERELRAALAHAHAQEQKMRAALVDARAQEQGARSALADAQVRERELRNALADAQARESETRATLTSECEQLDSKVARYRRELDRAKRTIEDLGRAVESSELKLAATKKRATAFAERLQNTRESASFQIGQAVVAAGRSVKGTLRLPLALAHIYRSAKRRRVEDAASTSTTESRPQVAESVRTAAGAVTAAPAPAPAGNSLPRPEKVRLADVPYMSRPLGGVEGHQQVYSGEPLVSVIMTSFNTGALIEPAVKSILAQTWTNLELIVVDDCSTDDTRSIVERLAAADARIKLFCFGDNRGTYWCKNFGITQSSGVAVTFMDSDDTSHPSRIELQFAALNRPGYAVSTCNHIRVDTDGKTIAINGVAERIAYISQMIKRSVIREVGYFDTIRTSADDEMLRRIKVTYGPEAHTNVKRVLYTALLRDGSLTRDPENAINFVQAREGQSFLSPQRRHYAAMVSRWHDSLAQQNLRPYMPFPVVRRPFPVFGKLVVSAGRYDHSLISACLASYPPRQDKLKEVVNALLPQVDRLFVYLNEYDEVPSFLQHSRITVELGGKERNLRDNGKFFFAAKAPPGYVLTVDDDIVYPPDYVQALVRKIEFYERRAVVGVHGTIFAKPIRSYFRGRTLYHFELPLEHDVVVNQLGTGTVAFHTELLRPDFDAFKTTGMADVWLALQCKAARAPMIAISREAGWLQPMGLEETTLFREFRNEDARQTELVRSVAPWREEISGASRAIVDARRREFGEAYARLLPRPAAAPVAESVQG